jgi:hypothetical protein
MDGWCALKRLLGLGGPRLDVRGGAESRDAGVRGVSFGPGCGAEDIYVASNETCKCDRNSNNNSGGFFGSEGTDGAGDLMRSKRRESSCSSAYMDLVNRMLAQGRKKKVADQKKLAFSLSY